ncbi:MAG: arginine--tRNA ligase, partial [Rhodocyclaceae bacterium]|nr:arginine--tRNA ligase [Rhodocyclaceae bacterium]
MATTNANVREALEELLRTALGEVAPECARTLIHLERPKQAGHGDFASNLAMQLARTLKCNPRELAQRLVAALPESALVDKVEVAGAGFINFSLSQAAQTAVVAAVLAAGEHYGRGAQRDERIMVEFVSANPTGPLHVGHGRGAAYGASLANLLEFAGYDVEREYYVNDAGRQMDILALSTWLRYLGLHGVDVPFPPNAYRGEYVIDMARAVRERHGDAFVVREIAQVLADVPPLPDADDASPQAARVREQHLDALIANARRLLGEGYATVHSMALSIQLEDCRDDLAEFGVYYDTWFSERSLFDHDLIARALRVLQENGHLYEQDGAKWFRSTHFGDEKDRVVQRENGQYTYFASDIAYHQNKFERGFDRVINVWGADHHGYIARVKGALSALGLDAERLQVALVQFAVLYRNGEKASMSTRAG